MERVKKVVGYGSKLGKEFKEFANRGNVVDLAVGLMIGSAFGKIVNAAVNDMFMPIIGIFVGKVSFAELSFTINGAVIKYGSFVQNTVDFLIIAFCVFIMVKMINKLKDGVLKSDAEEAEGDEDEVEEEKYIILLEEIRDILKKEGGFEAVNQAEDETENAG